MIDLPVSILMLTYNRLEMTKKCLPSALDKIGDFPCEVLIWDNHSTDGTFDWLVDYGRADCRITKVFESDENIGMEAINYLAKEATTKYILKIDDDLELPNDFVRRIIAAYEELNEEKLLFLSWDMKWMAGKTFATRSGKEPYRDERGFIRDLSTGEKAYVSKQADFFMVNGACRLSLRSKFLEIGGHPEGIIYGVDKHISKRAADHGLWVAFLSGPDLVLHLGTDEDPEYRKFKNEQLKKHDSPMHV